MIQSIDNPINAMSSDAEVAEYQKYLDSLPETAAKLQALKELGRALQTRERLRS